ncbi:MAG TPA: VOC family protein [Vitreimonas sp.]|uniref:VOC family protein n=1 Tax=Vitreimonas sp. TaxID=3069702 RepID=UPI002D33DEAE|nr:VOC family protein [Vitreimonas sp.]HYD86681.1 VOC family protein [Vitreimonas sp.]
MAIDHVSVGVTNMKRSKAFYDAALAPLGMQPVMPVEYGGQLVAVGYGQPGKPAFWIGLPINGQPASMGNGVHIAFRAETRAAVDAFFLAALDQGGIEDGRPGLRTEYHPDYYGAFVRDPDGNKIEAVSHAHE